MKYDEIKTLWKKCLELNGNECPDEDDIEAIIHYFLEWSGQKKPILVGSGQNEKGQKNE